MAERRAPSHNPENPIFQQNIGLQTRLLMGGEALNPGKTDLRIPAFESLQNFAERDYSPFNKASIFERKSFWRNSEYDSFEQQKKAFDKFLVLQGAEAICQPCELKK